MNADYPLRFEPIFRLALWGGRRLETVLGKTFPAGNDYAESWEIVDHGADQSCVTHGPLRGMALSSLVRELGADLLGRHNPQDHFPLLFKFLDVRENLSVQVHPNDEQAARLDPPDRGKSEAWFVLRAEPASRVYAGLRDGVDRTALELAIAHGQIETCLHSFEPASGDCVWVPAGTVHALGAGLLVAEIQQSSDTTFRLFDWNRVGPDGLPRPLHVRQAVAAVDFQAGPVRPVSPKPTVLSHVNRLIAGDKFVVDRWSFSTPKRVGGDDRCHIVVPVSGRVRLERDAVEAALGTGQTALIPAAAGDVELEPDGAAVMLDIYLPS
jgi:mannose-6-phosphate isomerase